MATPAKSVQCRDAGSIVEMYRSMDIPAYGVKQNNALNYKYTGENIDEGAARLEGFLGKIEESESCAIYTLCLYEDPKKGINERTPVDLSFNFRLIDQQQAGYGSGELYRGSYGQLLGEISGIKKQLAALQQQPEESKLGIIGELMDVEALQPVWMAVGSRIADLVLPAPKVGELKRVSGIPGAATEDPTAAASANWRDDQVLIDAVNRLAVRVPDLGPVLQKLAIMSEKNPGKFNVYLAILRKLG